VSTAGSRAQATGRVRCTSAAEPGGCGGCRLLEGCGGGSDDAGHDIMHYYPHRPSQNDLATQPPRSRLPAFVCTPAARNSESNTPHAPRLDPPRHATALPAIPHTRRAARPHIPQAPSCQATADCHGAARRPHSPSPPDILLRLPQRLLSLPAAPLMEACARYQT
jgi:hypothetical protein